MLSCTGCRAPLPPGALLVLTSGPYGLEPCPACGVPLSVEVFPALFRPLAAGAAGEAIVAEGESSCFYHPQKRAILPCEWCGRFLCALCDLDLNGEHICPVCLERGRKKGRLANLDNQRTLHDQIALSLAVWPMLVFYFTVLTAPIALFVALRHWSSPGSIVRPSRVRLVLAILISSLQILGWVALVVFLVSRYRAGA